MSVVYLLYRPVHVVLWEKSLGGGVARKKKSKKLTGSMGCNRYPIMLRTVSVSAGMCRDTSQNLQVILHIPANTFHEFNPWTLCVMCLGRRSWWWESVGEGLLHLMMSEKQRGRDWELGRTIITMSPGAYFLQMGSTSCSFQNLPIQCHQPRKWWTHELVWVIS